jgi:hypothetical protein
VSVEVKAKPAVDLSLVQDALIVMPPERDPMEHDPLMLEAGKENALLLKMSNTGVKTRFTLKLYVKKPGKAEILLASQKMSLSPFQEWQHQSNLHAGGSWALYLQRSHRGRFPQGFQCQEQFEEMTGGRRPRGGPKVQPERRHLLKTTTGLHPDPHGRTMVRRAGGLHSLHDRWNRSEPEQRGRD